MRTLPCCLRRRSLSLFLRFGVAASCYHFIYDFYHIRPTKNVSRDQNIMCDNLYVSFSLSPLHCICATWSVSTFWIHEYVYFFRKKIKRTQQKNEIFGQHFPIFMYLFSIDQFIGFFWIKSITTSTSRKWRFLTWMEWNLSFRKGEIYVLASQCVDD